MFFKRTIRFITIALLLTTAFLMVSPSPALAEPFSGGSGTEGDPYQIATAADWTTLTGDGAYWSKYFILTADIDFGGATLAPIGYSTQFTGSFNGDGHTLSNAVIYNESRLSYVGVFGCIGSAGRVSDLYVEDISATGRQFVGGLAGDNRGTITNCGSNCDVTGLSYEVEYPFPMIEGPSCIGGLAGRNAHGTITGCYATGTVTTPASSEGGGMYVGGLVGEFYYGSITNCYATGPVTGYNIVGGLIGGLYYIGTVTNCYATGSVTGTTNVGGLMGYNDDTVTGSYWDTETTGQASSDGGTGLTTDEMTYPYAGTAYVGWDFTDAWAADTGNFNNGYPFLQCQTPPSTSEMNVEGNSTEIADGDTTPSTEDHTDFGSVLVAPGSVTRTFTIYNTGTDNLTLGGTPMIAIGGTNAADFTVTANGTSPVVTSGSTTFRITFDPSAAGTRTATVSIANNDADENPYDFAIQGTGTGLAVAARNPGVNALEVSAASDISVQFNTDINGATASQTTFKVNGSLSGPASGSYNTAGDTVTFNPTTDFLPGETVTVTLTTGIRSTGGLALASPVTWQFVIDAASGHGYFADSGQSLGSSYSYGVAMGDVDGDGDLDAFAANYDGEPNKVWLNDGSGVFTDSGQALGDSYSTKVALGDVDGDGDLDAFVANDYYGQPNKVWLNDGSGVFTDSGQSLGDSNSYGIALGDMDGDGDLDAFVANLDASKIWLNDGSGVFTDSGQSLGGSESTGVALGDVDGDGDLDAFVTGHIGQPNKVWLNDGSGVFTDSGQSLGSDNFKWGVALGDMDGDGDLDAFVAYRSNQPNKLWLNDGSGAFTDSGQSLGSSDSYGIALGDMDGDGDLDALVANYLYNKAWLNDGSGVFTDNSQTTPRVPCTAAALGDVDGDGDLDAFLANRGTYPNKVWLNSPPPAPEMDVQGNDVSIADGDTTPSTTDHTDFGSVDTASGNITRTFTIYNTGTADLTLGGTPMIAIGGTHAADFTVTANGTSPVAASGNTTFRITFDPSADGTRTATVSITNNDSDENPYNFSIQGTGGLPEINLKQNTTDIADGGNHDFGSHNTGSTTDVVFTIENTGTGTLTLTTPLTLGGADADQFSIQSQPSSTVAAAGNTTFTVRFSPTSTGAKTATISITNNDGDENPYNFAIQGTGVVVSSGGGSGGTSYQRNTINIFGTQKTLTSYHNGKLVKDVETTSTDGTIVATLSAGTVITEADGKNLSHDIEVAVNEDVPPPPDGAGIISLPYDFTPDGLTFDPPITLTFTYDDADVPEGVAEADLTLAYYDESTGEWVMLTCSCDEQNNCITACISHFTTFAILVEAATSEPITEPVPTPEPVDEPEPKPAPTPAPVVTPEPQPAAPEVTPSPEPPDAPVPSPSPEPDNNRTFIWIIIAIGAVLVVYLVYRFATRRD